MKIQGVFLITSHLWSWIDANAIKGNAYAEKFGFTDVKETSNGGATTMNDIEIEIIHDDGKTIASTQLYRYLCYCRLA